MHHLSTSVMDGERTALKTEVPGPNFITQGVSPRRDVGFYIFDIYEWLGEY
jgi:hypothetical protein